MSDEDYDLSPPSTPVESYDGDSDQEWVVAGVVGESVTLNGTRYEVVKWGEGWTRKDGTNTTWEKPGEQANLDALIARWDRKQAAKRKAAAEESSAIAVGIEDWHMLHEDLTIERARGYEELKKQYMPDGNPRQPIDFDGMLKRVGPAPSASASTVQGSGASADVSASTGRRPRSTSSHRPSSSHSTSGPSTSRDRASSGSPASSSADRIAGRPMRRLPHRANVRIQVSSTASDSEMEQSSSRRSATVRKREARLQRRKALEDEWAERLQGAAPVTFVNDVNEEDLPRLVQGFRYLERRYVRAPDVPTNKDVIDCLVSCDCVDRCTDAAECGCQGPSELMNASGEKTFAYNRKGLYKFTVGSGMEIIECNRGCPCEDQCRNRVAQLPRDVPIEVYRTQECGWGARATVPLPRGKVVGVYTGRLIRREEADTYRGEHKSYIFDLDVHEHDAEDDDDSERYSVDGYAHGNWTRFINHSCHPNLRVVPVIWDTIPELNQPYLAFVATRDIPPRTELSIDYDPKAAKEFASRKNKGRMRQETPPEGARECMCGADNCRGWVRV